MGLIFKPKRFQYTSISSRTELIQPGEIFIVKQNNGSIGANGSIELFCNTDTTSDTAKNIVETGHDNSYQKYGLHANFLKMTAITPTTAGETNFIDSLINSVHSNNLGTRIADMTQAICSPRLVWSNTIVGKDGTVDVNCDYLMSGSSEWRHAILVVMTTDVTVGSTGPLIPVILPDPINFIGASTPAINYTYRGGYYQGSTNGGGAYFKITKLNDTTIRIALDQAYINGTAKSGLTGQYSVKVLYEKYAKSFWNN